MDPVPLASVDATALRWLRRRESPLEFDLLAGDRLVGSMTWGSKSGTLATFATASTTWTLKRGGFLNPHITVRAAGSTATAARLSVHLNYHRIEVTGAGAYRFHRAGVLVPAWKVTEEGGSEVLHVEPVREGRKLTAGAVLASEAATRKPAFPLLVGTSWYFIVLAWFEDETLAALEPA
ncbi:MAG TPA: hypothetical protein VMC82_00445 [Thermoplasmata archaeon]|nr:hypothetical protein [Thermoplasmata archaeon]